MTTESNHQAGTVPPRALAISMASLAVPVAGALFFPDTLGEYTAMLWLLALVPAFLLAYYRGWRGVTLACGIGMALLALTQAVTALLGRQVQDTPLFILVVTTYIGVALGIGWLSEGLRDFAERRRTEDVRRRLEKALETMQLGVTITDTARRIVYVNPAEAEVHGYTVDELLGKDASIFAPAAKPQPLLKWQLRNLSSWKRESTNARKDGSTFPVQLTSDAVLDGSGDPIGVVTTCENITIRKERQRQLERATRELRKSRGDLQAAQMRLIEAEKLESVGRLAAGVAHEVKNPLMVILTGLKILAQRQQSDRDEDLQTLLDEMTDAVARADSVIRGLLDFSRPHELTLTPQDLNGVVEQSLSLVKHELDKHHVTLETVLQPDLPRVELDEFKIQQVLINLFTNAAHAMPDGGILTVRTSVEPQQMSVDTSPSGDAALPSGQRDVTLVVDDTGTGIPGDALAKIFDPFFTTKPTGKGTGLGLSVAWQIVEMHDATIEFENRDEGGVRVTIVFRSVGE